jgi:hypothetical protein
MTYACPAWELAADIYLLNCSACKLNFALFEIYQGANRCAICTRLSTSRMYTITLGVLCAGLSDFSVCGAGNSDGKMNVQPAF